MTMYGANPEQLAELGTTLRRQVNPIEQLTATVTGVLSGTMWQGPARDRFEQDWNGSFRKSLDGMKAAFDAAGNDCILRSQDLMRVMGAGH